MSDIWERKFTKDVSRNPTNAPFLKHYLKCNILSFFISTVGWWYFLPGFIIWAKWGYSKWDLWRPSSLLPSNQWKWDTFMESKENHFCEAMQRRLRCYRRIYWDRNRSLPQVPEVSSPFSPLWEKSSLVFIGPVSKNRASVQKFCVMSRLSPI